MIGYSPYIEAQCKPIKKYEGPKTTGDNNSQMVNAIKAALIKVKKDTGKVTIHNVNKLPTKTIDGVQHFTPGKGNTEYNGATIAKGKTLVIGNNPNGHSVINNLVDNGDLVLGGLMI